MKDILVAIDFSKGSVHALEYAIELANVAQSNITLVWIDVQAANETQGSPESGEFRDESKKNLEELVHTYKGKLTGGKLNCKIRKGKVYQELAAQAKQNNSSLLILGAHGVSGFEEYWIGSNASRVVAYSPALLLPLNSISIIPGGSGKFWSLSTTPHKPYRKQFLLASWQRFLAPILTYWLSIPAS
ncbi:MAG: universal stress protein [Bacteroidales bacterium]|nr:universal stress protein [Bacteroidales bacterium]